MPDTDASPATPRQRVLERAQVQNGVIPDAKRAEASWKGDMLCWPFSWYSASPSLCYRSMRFSAQGRVMADVRCSYRRTVRDPAVWTFDLCCCHIHSLMVDSIAPYLDSGDLEFEEYTEQNHLMQPSPYRGQPTAAVEDAWIRLWRCTCPIPRPRRRIFSILILIRALRRSSLCPVPRGQAPLAQQDAGGSLRPYRGRGRAGLPERLPPTALSGK